MKKSEAEIQSNRRSFLKKGALAGGAAAISAGLLSSTARAFDHDHDGDDRLTPGDAAILRFALAAELIEADLWIQYAELGGFTPGDLPLETLQTNPSNSYQAAFLNLDGDGPQYITSNTLDEVSHAAFLNAYLLSKGAETVDFDAFRKLPLQDNVPIGQRINIVRRRVTPSAKKSEKLKRGMDKFRAHGWRSISVPARFQLGDRHKLVLSFIPGDTFPIAARLRSGLWESM